MSYAVLAIDKDDPLCQVFKDQEHNANQIDIFNGNVLDGEEVETKLLKTDPSSLSMESFVGLQQDLAGLDKSLGIKTVFVSPALESMSNPATRKYIHELSMEAIGTRIRTIIKSLRRIIEKVLGWIGKIIERVDVAIEGTYGRAKKMKRMLSENKRAYPSREITNPAALQLFINGNRAMRAEDFLEIPNKLKRLLEVCLADSKNIVEANKTLFLKPEARRDSVLAGVVDFGDLKRLSKQTDEKKEEIQFNFDFGLKGNRLRIGRPNLLDRNYDPRFFKSGIFVQEAKVKVKSARSLSADEAINTCTNIMEVIDAIRESRKDIKELTKSVKAIDTSIENVDEGLEEELFERRRDLMGISKILMGELGTVYKFIYVTTRDLMDVLDLTLTKPGRLDSKDVKKAERKQELKQRRNI